MDRPRRVCSLTASPAALGPARAGGGDYLAAGAAVGAAVGATVGAAEGVPLGAGGLAWGSSAGAAEPPQATAKQATVTTKGMERVLMTFMRPE